MPFSSQNDSSAETGKQTASLQVSDEEPLLQPLLFLPLLKRTCWGGTRLGDVFNKPIGDKDDYAESWEISDLPGAQSEVAAGPHAGWTLADLRKNYREQLFGTDSPYSNFPLLIKFLDIQDRLSVQVHPDDHLALLLTGGIGKTETWIVLDSDPGSRLYAGLKEGVDRDQLEAALENDRVIDCLHSFPVHRGDAIHLPAGTVHAVQGSILLAEVQQASDLSFRLHDWNREEQGEPERELHVDQGLLCTNFEQGPVAPLVPEVVQSGDHTETIVVDCPHYTVHQHRSTVAVSFQQDNRFRILVLLEGSGTLESEDFKGRIEPGQTWLIPARCPQVTVTPDSEPLSLLNVFID